MRSPGQFSYVEKDGQLEIDPNSAVGIWLAFNKGIRTGQAARRFACCRCGCGHAFFGEKGIDGQKTAWRLKKVRFLAEQGFEL